MEFEFTTDPASAEHILKLWTICRLDSCGPEKLREISSALDPVTDAGERAGGMVGGKARRSTRKSPSVRERGTEKPEPKALFRNKTLGRVPGWSVLVPLVQLVWCELYIADFCFLQD